MHRFQTVICIFVIGLFCSCSPPVTRSLLPANSREYYLTYNITPLFTDVPSLKVVMNLPADAPLCDTFHFADQVPGSYELRHYAKYIQNFVVIGSKGDTVPCTLVDSSCFVCDTIQPIDHICYKVLSTYNAKADSIKFFAGTYFNAGCYQINPYAVFGFFNNLVDKPIKVMLEIPGDWTIGTALRQDSIGNLYADNTFELLDSPILLGDLSSAAFTYYGRSFFIYTHCDNGDVRSKGLKGILKKAVGDVDNFLGGFPSGNYTFLVNIINDTMRYSGAHEHLHSSIYGFGNHKKRYFKEIMPVFARHELFHVLSPLSLQSREIYENKYTGKHPVTHLWFYEGIAQWATYKMMLLNHRISAREYLNVVSNALTIGDTKTDSLTLIDCSKNVLKYHDIAGEIYRRGLVFGAVLDVHLINKTAGRVTLKDVIRKMGEMYPAGHPFDTDSLFQIIATLSDPAVKAFLEHYLQTNDILPIKEVFGVLGIDFEFRKDHPLVKAALGFIPYNDKVSGRCIVREVFNENRSSGFQAYDTLLTVDGEDFLLHGTDPDLIRRLFFSPPGTSYTAVVRRNGKETILHPKTVPAYLRNIFAIREYTDPKSLALRKIWMTR
jgi:predicted metalloprotease with PDZ domain